jgi:hypothetical protein
MMESKHTEADNEVGRTAVEAVRNVVPKYYDCSVVLRNTQTGALLTVANVGPEQEQALLEAAANSVEYASFKVPEPH